MRIVSSHLLRGANVFSAAPCLMAVIEVMDLQQAPADGGQLASQLADAAALSPAERSALARQLSVAAQGNGAAGVAGTVAGLTLALQQLAVRGLRLVETDVDVAGSPSHLCLARPEGAATWRLALALLNEAVAEAALGLALQHAPMRADEAPPPDWAAALATLRALAAGSVVDESALALLRAARQRGLPVLRAGANAAAAAAGTADWQVGWGRRLALVPRSTPPAATPHPEVAAAGRIPVVAITGTNGKTTTTLLLAHALRQLGGTVGVATTEGVFIGAERVEKGDCTGYWSARRLLCSPLVDTAVLETARGGLLKRGLAFDRCDVGVVLNVSADHLGLDGVTTVEQLAQVKGLIARSARHAAVLNAEDPFCVAMAASLQAGCVPLYFALDPVNTVLQQHLAAGGRAALLDDGWLVLAESTRRQPLLRADAMPSTAGGHARHNVANALAAAAALWAMGLPPAVIAQGLGSFSSDARSNPLRLNRLQVGPLDVVIDYAHNVAACSALCQAARAMLDAKPRPGRLIGVVTAPGDRRSADLFQTGRVCGSGFDELLVYEVNPRGRGAGETSEAIAVGARSVPSAPPVRAVPAVRDALAQGFQAAGPDDLLVFTCGGPFDDFIAVVEARLPQAAAAVRQQLGLA